MSSAAVRLLRALIERASCGRDWVLLSDIQSIDWQSLTLAGERHRIELKLLGVHARRNAELLVAGLADAEFDLGGQVLADIAVTNGPAISLDGTAALTIEALTIDA
jgi:hypothetical protein